MECTYTITLSDKMKVHDEVKSGRVTATDLAQAARHTQGQANAFRADCDWQADVPGRYEVKSISLTVSVRGE